MLSGYITVRFITSLALTNYSLLSITLYNISPIVINIIDIKILPITIGTVYTSLINLDWVLFADVKYAPYSYKGRLNISRPYYIATLSLIRLSLAPELIKYLDRKSVV